MFVFHISHTLEGTSYSYASLEKNPIHFIITLQIKRIHAVTVYLLLPFLTSSISYSKLETSTPLFAKDETVVLESNETREHFKLKKSCLKELLKITY